MKIYIDIIYVKDYRENNFLRKSLLVSKLTKSWKPLKL